YDGEEVYQQAKQLWLRHLHEDANNLTLLDNAAQFFLLHNPMLAESLLQKGATLEPDNPHWAESLGQLLSLHARRVSADAARDNAVRAFAALERGYALQQDERARFSLLTELAQAAFAAGEFGK